MSLRSQWQPVAGIIIIRILDGPHRVNFPSTLRRMYTKPPLLICSRTQCPKPIDLHPSALVAPACGHLRLHTSHLCTISIIRRTDRTLRRPNQLCISLESWHSNHRIVSDSLNCRCQVMLRSPRSIIHLSIRHLHVLAILAHIKLGTNTDQLLRTSIRIPFSPVSPVK